MGTLFVVATPIGNMEDITLRAIRILKEVKLIAAEDTRRTKKILNHYGISTPLASYHEHNEREMAVRLVEKLKEGSDIALVSDAGTPGISDPGYRLIKLAIENSVLVVPAPGASALTAVLSVSGLPTDEFTFKGFIPAGSGRRKQFFSDMKGRGGTFVMYEAPSRIKKTLSEMKEILGDARIVVGREVTKLYEEILRGTIGDMERAFSEKEPLGEITLVVRSEKEEMPAGEVLAEVKRLLDAGAPWKDAVKAVALESGLPKSHVYKEALKLKRTGFPLRCFNTERSDVLIRSAPYQEASGRPVSKGIGTLKTLSPPATSEVSPVSSAAGETDEADNLKRGTAGMTKVISAEKERGA